MMFLRQGGRQVPVGLSVGVLLAVGLAKGLALVLFQVNTANPRMYLGVTVALAGTCLVAILVPARRALMVDPVVAIRYEQGRDARITRRLGGATPQEVLDRAIALRVASGAAARYPARSAPVSRSVRTAALPRRPGPPGTW